MVLLLSCICFKRPGGVIIEGNIHGQLRFSVTDPFSGSQKVYPFIILIFILNDFMSSV